MVCALLLSASLLLASPAASSSVWAEPPAVLSRQVGSQVPVQHATGSNRILSAAFHQPGAKYHPGQQAEAGHHQHGPGRVAITSSDNAGAKQVSERVLETRPSSTHTPR